jgi:AcrR family transcriptional regulator
MVLSDTIEVKLSITPTSPGKESSMSTVEPRRKALPPKAKRLKPDERRAALLRAAKELSVEQGAAAPSLDAIIERAGGSRRSIYTEFGGKAGLLDALVNEIATEIQATLSDGIDQNKDLRASLARFARSLASVLTSERGVALSRVVLQDIFFSRERARIFFARGPGKGLAMLTDILEAARARGEIEVRDCRAAAACFIGMARAFFLECMLQLRPSPGEREIEAHVDTVVDIFLDGLRPREGGGGDVSENIEPGHPDIHRQERVENGDFERGGSRSGK